MDFIGGVGANDYPNQKIIKLHLYLYHTQKLVLNVKGFIIKQHMFKYTNVQADYTRIHNEVQQSDACT